jgi:uncharacterized tellurite resistance protein B-like protein
MDETLRKKINLLVHLAKSDGKFHVSETAFLKDLLRKNDENDYDFETEGLDDDPLKSISSKLDKQELLYWCLQLIKADGIIHPDEVAFCKELSIKLNFDPLIIDTYSNKLLPTFDIFCEESQGFEG